MWTKLVWYCSPYGVHAVLRTVYCAVLCYCFHTVRMRIGPSKLRIHAVLKIDNEITKTSTMIQEQVRTYSSSLRLIGSTNDDSMALLVLY